MKPSVDTTSELESLRIEFAQRDERLREIEVRRAFELKEARLAIYHLSLEAHNQLAEQESALRSAREELKALHNRIAETDAELTRVLAKLQQSQRESSEISVQAWSLMNDYMQYLYQDTHRPVLRIFSRFYPLKRFRLRKLVEKLRDSTYFDAEWYLAQNVDVAESGIDPALHFIEHGFQEGRAPNARFEKAR